MTEGPKIVLPQNPEIKKALEAKLEEYKGRLAKIREEDLYLAPEIINCSSTAYKIEVTERLLEKGKVDTWDLSRELNEEYSAFNADNFNNACSVIDDYCKTGGNNVVDGTGFIKKG